MREREVEQLLVRVVRDHGGKCFKFVSPGTSGVPDRLIILPGSRVVFVETKAPGKHPRRLQQEVIKQIQALGIEVYVLDTPDKVREFAEKTL